MRAAILRELGGPDALQLAEVDRPVGAHPLAVGGRLLIEVHAAGVSFPDLLRSRGEYQMRPELPFATGAEVAGVVVEADPETGFAAGERVAALTHWGGVAEYALAMPQHTLRLPDSLSFVQGAALYLNYCTAWYALHRLAVEPGETVLVQGAAGGVGTAALEIITALGARRLRWSPPTRRSRSRARWGPIGSCARTGRGSTRCASAPAAACKRSSTRSAATASWTRCARCGSAGGWPSWASPAARSIPGDW